LRIEVPLDAVNVKLEPAGILFLGDCQLVESLHALVVLFDVFNQLLEVSFESQEVHGVRCVLVLLEPVPERGDHLCQVTAVLVLKFVFIDRPDAAVDLVEH